MGVGEGVAVLEGTVPGVEIGEGEDIDDEEREGADEVAGSAGVGGQGDLGQSSTRRQAEAREKRVGTWKSSSSGSRNWAFRSCWFTQALIHLKRASMKIGSKEGYDEHGGEGGNAMEIKLGEGSPGRRTEDLRHWVGGKSATPSREEGCRGWCWSGGLMETRAWSGIGDSPWKEQWRRRKRRRRKIQKMIWRNRIREIQDPSAR